MIRLFVIALAALTSFSALAHHGITSQFDQSQEVIVEGVVTKIRFVNPHAYIYMDVTSPDGSVLPWRCELRSGGIMRRTGWSEEMFADGTWLRIVGAPARREAEGCHVRTIEFANGRVIERNEVISSDEFVATRNATTADGAPNFNGLWVAPQRRAAPLPGAPEAAPRVEQPFTMTAAGAAAVADYVREDNPRYECKATSILTDWISDEHINKIVQTQDTIELSYGFMDLVRTIHLNIDTHPDDIELTRAGHSIGKWVENKLVVDTTAFEPGYLWTRPGTKNSDQLHIVEEFYLINEGKGLVRQYQATDPVNFTNTFMRHDVMILSTSPYEPYDCEDLTQELVEGI